MGKQYFLNYFEMFEFIDGLVASGPMQLSFFFHLGLRFVLRIVRISLLSAGHA